MNDKLFDYFRADQYPSMSHLHERHEKKCLNCGATVVGRYCHDCGQENLEPRENFGHILHHFVEDVTHFDGKFFSTIKLLLTKPGFLAEEYMKGRRAAYLNPIRMYLFVSAIFFIMLFSMVDRGVKKGINTLSASQTMQAEQSKAQANNAEIRTVRQYDSLQAVLPAASRDGKADVFVTRRLLALEEYVDRDPGNFSNLMLSILHTLPKIMFITMPLMALLFYLLYYKQRDTYYYVAHGIFTLHYVTTQFLILLIAIPFFFIPVVGVYIGIAIFMTIPVYLFIAMRRFYKQSAFKTFIKFNNLLILYNIVTVVLLVLYITGYTLTTAHHH